MFEFRYVELMNWAYWPTIKVPLDQRTIMISGPNGSGKTTFLDALRTLLRVPRLSSNRRFTNYVVGDVGTAVVKAVVTNEAGEEEQAPFAFKGFKSNRVTLAVILRNRGGRWERRFAILDGEVELSGLQELHRSDLLSPESYSYELHQAGFSNALLKVLALEQGQTDTLCEKSPRELLDLLLDVHGDKEIIERYQRARENYQAASMEVSHLGARLAEERARLVTAERLAEAYRRYEKLVREKAELQGVLIPQAEYRDARRRRDEAELAIKDLNMRLHPLDREILDVQTRLANEDTELLERKSAVVRAQDAKVSVEKDERELDIRLNGMVAERKQLTALLESVDATPEEPVGPLRQGLVDVRRGIARREVRAEQLAEEVNRLEEDLRAVSGARARTIYPGYVQQFRDVLEQHGIDYRMLCDIVDIRDAGWQLAVESILGRDRFTVLVDPADQQRARQLGERCRYRAYITDRSAGKAAADCRPRSQAVALSMVEFLDDGVPEWVVEALNRTELVESVRDGMHAAGVSVTRQGYRQDRRGGIAIAVDHFYCGSLGQTAQKGELETEVKRLRGELTRCRQELATERRREEELQFRLSAQENRAKAETARSRKAELDGAISKVNEEHHQALEMKRQAELRVLDRLDELNRFERENDERRRWLAEKRSTQSDALSEIQEMQDVLARCGRQIGETEVKLGPEKLSDKALRQVPELDELTPRLYALENLLEEYAEEPDAAVVEVFEHHRQQFQNQERIYADHEAGLRNWTEEFRLARRKFTVVVDHTIREYRRNVLALAKVAGVDAEVALPQLSEEEDALETAELLVRFGYDGKRAQDIRGAGHSGGQRVVSSLILLMALATSGGRRQGGFFIIDEPFAHLSIERIDDVSRFLDKTQCQFILTSPTTHNVNVFSAARLQLNFRIKATDAAFAAVPTVIRR